MKTILIIDDDPVSLALVENVLAAEGYETQSAPTPSRALAILTTWKPDVILLDIQFHGLENGLEFARRLKSNIATRATPIVAFTAYGDRWSEAETKAAGCDAFLEKPITAKMRADAVRAALERTN